MTLDPVHHHILEQRILRDAHNVTPRHRPREFRRDPLGSNDHDRRTWRSWRDAGVHHTRSRQRLGRAIARLGRLIQGTRQEPDPTQSPTRS